MLIGDTGEYGFYQGQSSIEVGTHRSILLCIKLEKKKDDMREGSARSGGKGETF